MTTRLKHPLKLYLLPILLFLVFHFGSACAALHVPCPYYPYSSPFPYSYSYPSSYPTYTYTTNTYTSSAAKATERRQLKREVAKREAQDRLISVCEDANGFPFLRCKRNRQTGQWALKSGAFGAGVIAIVDNDSRDHNIRMYKNCAAFEGSGRHWRDNIRKCSPVRRREVPLFIKTPQYGTLGGRGGIERAEALFEREKQMTRELAPTGITPAIYDIVEGGRTRLLSDQFYTMEYLHSDTLAHVVLKISSDMELLILRAADTIAPLLHAAHYREAERHIIELDAELKLRRLQLLRLYEAGFSAVLDFWKAGYRHCDLHPNNIAIQLIESISVHSSEFAKLVKGGKGISVALQGHKLGDLGKLRRSLRQAGVDKIAFYFLDRRSVRLFDLTYVQRVGSRSKSSWTGTCQYARRHEDIKELSRVDVGLRKLRKVMLGTAKRILHREELQSLEAGGSSGQRAVAKKWMTVLSASVTFAKRVHDTLMEDNPTWAECISILQARTRALKKMGTPKNMKQRTAWVDEIIEAYPGCTLEDEERALKKAISMLRSHIAKA